MFPFNFACRIFFLNSWDLQSSAFTLFSLVWCQQQRCLTLLNIKWLYFPIVVSRRRSTGYRFQDFSIPQREPTLSSRDMNSHYECVPSISVWGLTSPCPLVFSGSSSPSYPVEEPSAFPIPGHWGLLISWGPGQVLLLPPCRCFFQIGQSQNSIRLFYSLDLFWPTLTCSSWALPFFIFLLWK